MADAPEGAEGAEGEEEEEKEPENIPGTGTSDVAKKTHQLLGASVAMLGGFTLGVAIGWTSSAFYINKQKAHPNEDIVNNEELIGALMPVGAMFVMPVLSLLLDRLGRKLIMLGMAPICVISFLIPGIVQVSWCWMVLRVIMGFCCAAFCVAAPIYVGEISQKEIRGTLGTMFQLLLTIGILYAYALGLSGDLLLFSILTALPPIVFFVCFLFFPETPLFLLGKLKEDAAIKSMQWYRGKEYNITTEFLEVKSNYEEMKNLSARPKDLIATKAAKKSLIIALGLQLFQQLSGINVVMFYATDVFKSAGSSLDPIYCSIILGVVQSIATLVSCLVVDRAGRKLLLYISNTGMGICLLALGCWFIYTGNDKPSKALGILPLIIINLYLICFSLGSGPIPWLMIGELFPKNIKGMSGSLSALFNWFLAAIVTFTFKPMVDAMGSAPPFFIYGIICLVGDAFMFFIVIETKGKSLDEIQDELAD